MLLRPEMLDGRLRPEETFPPHDFEGPVVVAYGAGVDSTALLIGLRQRRVPVDLILFADTGSEKGLTNQSPRPSADGYEKVETIAYLPIIGAWLEQNGMPPVRRLKRSSPRAGDTSLHGECLRKSVLPSLAYGGHSCSLKWKVDPQWAFTRDHYRWDRRRQRWPHGPTITKLIGYDAGPGDARRIANAIGKWPPGHLYRYPLKEWAWTREHCKAVILAEGLPLPMKSACFMRLVEVASRQADTGISRPIRARVRPSRTWPSQVGRHLLGHSRTGKHILPSTS